MGIDHPRAFDSDVNSQPAMPQLDDQTRDVNGFN
jgi:hypothetical protein